MKRSKFLKLTAGSMAATTFLGFPAFSRNHEQESSYRDVFRIQIRDDNNHIHEVYVKLGLEEDPDLNHRISVEYVKNMNSSKISCNYIFKKENEPSLLAGYFQYDVTLEEGPYCSTRDGINSFTDVDDYDRKIYDVLKTISYIEFKPRDEFHYKSNYIEAVLRDHNEDKIFELEHHETVEEEECFLTTACVQHKGLPDDCYELQKLREFRDNYMQDHPEGKEMIADYYSLAPAIVAELSNEANNEVFDFIYNELVLKCITMIENNKPELAMYYYKAFTEELSQKVLAPGFFR